MSALTGAPGGAWSPHPCPRTPPHTSAHRHLSPPPPGLVTAARSPPLGRKLPRASTAPRQPVESCPLPPKTVNFKPDSVDCVLLPFSPLPQPRPAPEPSSQASGEDSGACSPDPRTPRPGSAPGAALGRARPALRSKLASVASPQRNEAFDFACFLA